VLQRQPEAEEPTPEMMHRVGTAAGVLRYVSAPDGSHNIICQGEQRFRIEEFLPGHPFLVARVTRYEEREQKTPEIDARVFQLRRRALEALELLPQAPNELKNAIENMESAATLADLVASYFGFKTDEQQQVLETFDLSPRLDRVLRLLAYRLEVLRLSQEIGRQTQEHLTERQREAMLREQLQTIQRQLGEDDGKAAEVEQLNRMIDEAGMPEDVQTHVRKELKRLERMPEQAAEYAMIRTYLDWMVELPWTKESEESIDVARARQVLDEDHYGLEKVKRRILEFLAVRKLNPGGKSPILCFVGPPGVGKTSLGQSIARATGRTFARVSLGGLHDESEIRGHRRTYIGALPGNIIQAISKAAARNCVLMLDEMDKLGTGFHGDPASALLEVLDPEQNVTFRDNYIGVPFDLSRVMFIGTANMMDTVPGPLRDRMEVIELPGYTADEKLQIANRYLIGRQRAANGLSPEQCELTEDALGAIISGYTREAGVRNLEREIGAVFRHAAMRIAEGSAERMRVTPDDLATILGPRRFEDEVAMRTSVSGVATGLAWTPTGGDILFIEATRVPGSGRLILTGQLGDVMKESAQAALSLVKTRAGSLGIAADQFKDADVHVHVPAGAIPKDGPSAGVAMFTALVSLFTNRTVRHDVAMTGEISLRGLVLPIGGVKEKCLAALRAGIHTVLLPARNRKDVEDVPATAREQLKFAWLETVDDAIAAAIEGAQRQAAE
jgi:ATP-dependent Lon protease